MSSTQIARHFQIERRHYWYARCKLASDPLYAGVGEALRGTMQPLLDLGCGIGLLAHTLRADGFLSAYRGIDNDEAKIAAARAAAEDARFTQVQFDCVDLAAAPFPVHRGSVALLDVLQFLPRDVAWDLIDRVTACITPGARLVIRTGLDRAGARMRFTRAVDTFARAAGWMNTAAYWYPTREELTSVLRDRGLQATFSPTHGWLPLNNWLIVAKRG
jgi:2-polyprenyl-3-methyl-5-hydroxy-6-metoxy-1,4-benzoquinol methylase